MRRGLFSLALRRISGFRQVAEDDQVPVPVSVTDIAAAPPPAVILSTAVLEPVEVGSNAIPTVQLSPTRICAGQLWLCLNCPGFAPCSLMETIGKTIVPVLLIVTVLTALVVPRV